MRFLLIVAVVVGLVGCSRDGSSSDEPKGTVSDPVEVCARVADVCRIDSAKLGVCVYKGETTELACMSQH